MVKEKETMHAPDHAMDLISRMIDMGPQTLKGLIAATGLSEKQVRNAVDGLRVKRQRAICTFQRKVWTVTQLKEAGFDVVKTPRGTWKVDRQKVRKEAQAKASADRRKKLKAVEGGAEKPKRGRKRKAVEVEEVPVDPVRAAAARTQLTAEIGSAVDPMKLNKLIASRFERWQRFRLEEAETKRRCANREGAAEERFRKAVEAEIPISPNVEDVERAQLAKLTEIELQWQDLEEVRRESIEERKNIREQRVKAEKLLSSCLENARQLDMFERSDEVAPEVAAEAEASETNPVATPEQADFFPDEAENSLREAEDSSSLQN